MMEGRKWSGHLCLVEKMINLKISQIRTIEKSERVAKRIEKFVERVIINHEKKRFRGIVE